jgi:hypothetical protein
MALLGKRSWVRMQGRTNAALHLAARDMNAEFVAPEREDEFAGLRGRAHSCAFDLHVSQAKKEHGPALVLVVRHFHTQATWRLEGPGLGLPDVDPIALKNAIERACYSFAANH